MVFAANESFDDIIVAEKSSFVKVKISLWVHL